MEMNWNIGQMFGLKINKPFDIATIGNAVEHAEPDSRKFLVKYWTQPHSEFMKESLHEHIVEAVDSIHADQLFWDEVRVTEQSPLQYAIMVESIRVI